MIGRKKSMNKENSAEAADSSNKTGSSEGEDVSQIEAAAGASGVDTSVTVSEASANTDERPHLLLKDLVVMKGIIDVVTARGGFRPQEMATVGDTYNRLNGFLQALVAKQKQQSPKAEGDVQETADSGGEPGA